MPADAQPEERHEPAVELPTGPGVRLREAREKAGLTLNDVAARLHLDARTVKALEDEEYQLLPAPTFVRGYLRSYARLLELPAEPIVEAFDQQGHAPPALVADISERPQTHSGDFPVKIITWLIVGGLIALVVLWWNQQFGSGAEFARQLGIGTGGSSAPTTQTEGSITTTPAPVTAPPAPQGGGASTDVPASTGSGTISSAITPVAPTQPETTPPVAAGASSSAGGAETGAAVPGAPTGPAATTGTILAPPPAPAPTATPTGAAADPVSPAAAPQPAATAAAPAAPAPPPAPTESGPTAGAASPNGGSGSQASPSTASGTGRPARLVMRFASESWVEVYDRNGERLYYNLVRPGRELDLRGPGPLRVLLGNARGARVEFNGTPFDYAQYVERGIARFTLGE